MQIIYQIIVFYMTLHLLWFVLREKKIEDQASGAIVLILFLLRLLLIK